MEKRGVIQQGITPPESSQIKAASGPPAPQQLEDHVTKRAAEAASRLLNPQHSKNDKRLGGGQ